MNIALNVLVALVLLFALVNPPPYGRQRLDSDERGGPALGGDVDE